MSQNNSTIDNFLENFNGKEIDPSDVKNSIGIINDICNKIPSNGEYDSSIIGPRIGQYIYAIQECGKLLASFGLVEAYQKTESDKEFSLAALERAPQRGITTDGKAKLYAQMDEKYILTKNKLSEIQAVISYIDTRRSSLDKAQLHCKKILDRSVVEERFAQDHERFSSGKKEELHWINDENLK